MKKKLVISTFVVGLSVLAFTKIAEAHSATLSRGCNLVTLANDNSDGTLHILAQTGGAFTVGETIPSHGTLQKVAVPSSAYSVTVNWSTDSTHRTYSVGAMTGCVIVTTTTSTTQPTVTTSTTVPHSTPTSVVPSTVKGTSPSTSSTPGLTDIDTPVIVTATPAFTG